MPDLSGQYIGRYHIVEQLGEGGMAVVYKAYDTRLEREVAVKIIRKGAFPVEILDEVLQRFEREAKSLAHLSHPNIVKVHDYGEYEDSPYLVLEYLPGGTLKKMLGKPIAWQDAVRLLLPIARGVEYAHQRGIIHRDIKPANILITESGEPMLSDFGIAKILEREQTTALTGSGMAVGTPEYMAPEQWTGTTSPKSDLYSLGMVLYEMVTGRKPYMADTPAAVLIKQATEALPRPSLFEPSLPESLEHLLTKALAKKPEDRYADMGEFIRALESLSGETNPNARPTTLVAGKKANDTLASPARPVGAKMGISQFVKTLIPGAIAASRGSRRWPVGMMFAGAAAVICVMIGCIAILAGPSVVQNWLISVRETAIVAIAPTAALKITPPTMPEITPTDALTANGTLQAPLFFTEYFTNGLENWKPLFLGNGDSNDASIKLKNGKLNFTLESRRIYAYYFYTPHTYKNVRLTLQAVNLGKSSNNIGLVCHKTSEGWYEFSVGNDGLWSLYFRINNSNYQLIINGGSSAVKQGKSTNVYEMTCAGDEITLGVNGVNLKTFAEKHFALREGQIGFTISSLESVPVITEIDSLEIKSP